MGFGEEIREEFSGGDNYQNQGYDQQQGGYDQQGGNDRSGYDQQQQGGYGGRNDQQGGYGGGDNQQQGQSWEKKLEGSGENAIIDQGISMSLCLLFRSLLPFGFEFVIKPLSDLIACSLATLPPAHSSFLLLAIHVIGPVHMIHPDNIAVTLLS